MLFCNTCETEIENDDKIMYCPNCGAKLDDIATLEKKFNLLNGSNGYSTILEDGNIHKMDEKTLKPFRFRFGTKNVHYYIEESRIIRKVITDNIENIFYLPYKDILRVHLFLGKITEIRISSLTGCLHLSTKTGGKAISFVDMIEIASARNGYFPKIEITFKTELDIRGGGVGVGF